ncbi:MAG: M20/M25/M40 family metallo-hydrolase [Nitrospirae bacterium]|nr:M20/M25/M40 family metallo-hydrolase [Nitrospirota bacterium]
MNDSLKSLFEEIDRAGPIELLCDLVRIPSHRGLERQEEGVARGLGRYLEAHGFEVHLEEVVAGRPNLICMLEGGAEGRHLLLCGHTDTVPLNDGDEGVGFSGLLRDGWVEGRGSVDMKGGLAAMAAAIVALRRIGALRQGKVTLAAVIDEEMESLGAEHLVSSGFTADGAIVGEPTENRLCLGHKGLEWLEFQFWGKAAHGGTPQAGVNAIDGAARFIELVRTELIPQFARRADSLLGPPTLNFGTIRGGDQPSTVAAACTLTADRRSVPGETFDSMTDELQVQLARVEAEMPGLRTEVCRVAGGMATLEHVALKTDAADPVAVAVSKARETLCGSPGEPRDFPAWTDGALLTGFGGIPTVILGPGDLQLAHSPREAVEVSQVLEAARLYALTALDFCHGDP